MNTQRTSGTLAHVLHLADGAPMPNREQELALVRRFKKEADRKAVDALARAHLRLVVATALRYRRYGVPLDELIAEGNFGLVRALDKFDPERGIRLSTYASYWIRSYMLSYVIKSRSLVSTASGPLRSARFFRVRREVARGTSLFGQGESAELWAAERLGVSAAELQAMLERLEAHDVSIDTPAHEDSHERLVDRLPTSDDAQEERLFDKQVESGVEAAVREAISELDPRERFIATQRLMVDGREELSLAEIGRALGVSRERARQLELRAKRKLRARVPHLGDAASREWLNERAASPATPSPAASSAV